MIKEANLFVEFETRANNWKDHKDKLKIEFGKSINSAIIHRRLADRKKKKGESSIQYLYEMLSNLKNAAIITYSIEGLPGAVETKSFMYKATTISEFKYSKNKEEFSKKKGEPSIQKKKTKQDASIVENSIRQMIAPTKKRGLNASDVTVLGLNKKAELTF